MRNFTLLPFALLVSGCLAPGQPDPTRYPWDPRNKVAAPHPALVARGAIAPVAAPQPKSAPPEGRFCVIALTPPNTTGITIGGKAPGIADCGIPPPKIEPSSKWHN